MRPDRDYGGVSCGQEVCINPADPASAKVMSSDELQHLIVGGDLQGRKLAEQINSRGGLSTMAKGQLTEHEGMRHHGAVTELANHHQAVSG